ncbi:MAG: hypothetical protein JRI45_11535 [Deltaproteobacteria bacterium]|nr:hypothetical protein [Deltaproteobacteria bacterium]MBW2069558.1 hypothetical protein [Deltaproteobacteria bacterium]
MIQILVILVCLVAIIVEFFSVLWGWIILALSAAFLLITLLGVKQKKWQYIPELSEAANQMLQKFGHYYAMPFAGRDFSASASTIMFAGAAIAIIGLFKGFWWGIGIGIINWFLMGLVARAFNPTNFLVDPLEQMAHEEIIKWITEKQKSKMRNI